MYRKIFAYSCVLVMGLWLATAATAAEVRQDKEFPYTKAEVVKAYDDVMQLVVNMRPLSATKEEKNNAKYHDSYFYMLTPNVAVMLEMNKGGANPTHVKAIGVEDGSQETRAFIVLNCMALMAAVTPTWKGDDRGAIGKALGITGEFPTVGKNNTITAVEGNRQLQLTFANNGEHGLTLTVQPE